MNYYNIRRRRFSLGDLSMVVWLIAINISIYLFFFFYRVIGGISFEELLQQPISQFFVIVPSSPFGISYVISLVGHMFTHLIFIHLALNMFVLFSLGGLSERIIGRKRFIWFYILSGIFAGLLSAVLAGLYGNTVLGERLFGSSIVPMMGASGAIFAIAGLYVMLLPRLKFMIIFLPFFSIPAYIMVPAVLFVTWIASIIFNLPIGNVAHFGGFIAGIAYGAYLRSKYRNKVMKLQRMFR